MNNDLKVGDLLKYCDTVNTSICLVTRVSNTHFDVSWLIARGFEDNRDTSTGYPINSVDFDDAFNGWSKLS